MLNSYINTSVAPTISKAFGIGAPRLSNPDDTLKPVDEMILNYCGSGSKIDKALIYNPDAVALWLYQKYTDKFTKVINNTRMALPMRTVMPSVTPVCFATIYSGVMPSVHGIQKYEKPVLKVDTLFDRLIENGKKPVIIAPRECSMSKIFNERDMDYIITDDSDLCFDAALEALDEDRHDCYVVYEGNYDSTMHGEGVEADISLKQIDINADHFDRLAAKARSKWNKEGYKSLFAWITDHGCHNDEIGRGTHGSDLEEDLNIVHFWGTGD
jgi:predicted AlkP superfamily pyrophosphatase or phosphodiesterase